MPPQIEKSRVSITIVSTALVLIAVTTFTWRVAQEVSEIKNLVDNLQCDMNKANEKIAVYESKVHKNDIKLAEISTDLKNITAMLVKIQEKI